MRCFPNPWEPCSWQPCPALSLPTQALLGVDPASLLFNRLLALDKRHERWLCHWLKQIYLVQEPVFGSTFPGLMHARLSAVVVHDRLETSWGMPPNFMYPLSASAFCRGYHEIDGPAGGLLRAFFAVDGQYIAALEMIRLEARSPFQPNDQAFLRLATPLLGRALRAAFDRERASACPNLTGPEATGVLILAPNQRVAMATPAARGWIDLLREQESIKGTHLPTAVAAALSSLRSPMRGAVPSTVLAATPVGLLRVEASLAGEDGSLAVTLAPQQPLTPPDVPAGWPLTRQERQVCALLLRGHSNRQIAAALVISENTVESHCRHVYEKLEVHSRNELLGRVFQETYRPALRHPGHSSNAVWPVDV